MFNRGTVFRQLYILARDTTSVAEINCPESSPLYCPTTLYRPIAVLPTSPASDSLFVFFQRLGPTHVSVRPPLLSGALCHRLKLCVNFFINPTVLLFFGVRYHNSVIFYHYYCVVPSRVRARLQFLLEHLAILQLLRVDDCRLTRCHKPGRHFLFC